MGQQVILLCTNVGAFSEFVQIAEVTQLKSSKMLRHEDRLIVTADVSNHPSVFNPRRHDLPVDTV